MTLELNDLITVMSRLTRYLESLGRKSMEIPFSHYWEISREIMYDPYAEPRDPGLGDLEDDWSDLSRLLSKEEMPNMLDLRDLASILRAIADHVDVSGPPHDK